MKRIDGKPVTAMDRVFALITIKDMALGLFQEGKNADKLPAIYGNGGGGGFGRESFGVRV